MKRVHKRPDLRLMLGAVLLGSAVTLPAQQPATNADRIPAGWKASNMKAIGYSDLNGLGESFKMAIKQVSGRWYLYMGH
ncbi:MAG: hypothetical protein HY655_04775, partial [Acidobacteria bacterium]|nr:hypothetical protein [Acidobacteriota bacterium]